MIYRVIAFVVAVIASLLGAVTFGLHALSVVSVRPRSGESGAASRMARAT